MLDEMITNSFELDFELIGNKGLYQILTPKLETDNLLLEFEKYVEKATSAMKDIVNFLNECDNQRKNFRTVLIKLSKEKLLINNLLKEEDSCLILNKLQVQEELKAKVIDKYIDDLISKDKLIKELQFQVDHCSCRNLNPKQDYTYKASGNNKTKFNTIDTSTNGSSYSLLKRNGRRLENKSSKQLLNERNNNYFIMNGDTCNISFDMEESLYSNSILRTVEDKENLISNSPIHTPTRNKKISQKQEKFPKRLSKSIEIEQSFDFSRHFQTQENLSMTDLHLETTNMSNYTTEHNNTLRHSINGKPRVNRNQVENIIVTPTVKNLRNVNKPKDIPLESLGDTTRLTSISSNFRNSTTKLLSAERNLKTSKSNNQGTASSNKKGSIKSNIITGTHNPFIQLNKKLSAIASGNTPINQNTNVSVSNKKFK